MKHFLLFLLCIISVFTLKAECYYSKFHLKFELETTSEHQLIAYKELSACDFKLDSLHNEAYLIQALRSKDSFGHLILFKTRISYEYCIEQSIACLATEKDSILELFDKIILTTQDIASLKLVEYIQFPAFDYLSTPLAVSDTVWTKKPPVAVLHCGAHRCYHRIFVHELTAQVMTVLAEIETLQAEIDQLEKENKIDVYNGDLYDAKLSTLVGKLPTGEKIVVRSACTD